MLLLQFIDIFVRRYILLIYRIDLLRYTISPNIFVIGYKYIIYIILKFFKLRIYIIKKLNNILFFIF